MIQVLRRNDSTHYQPIHTQARFHVLARIPHIDSCVANGKLEILAYVRVETHDIYILDGLIFTYFIVETHGLRPTTVQGIMGTQWTLSHKGMRDQLGFLFKLTFPLYFDLIAHSCYLL